MTNEDRQRTMDFILQQQAQFAASIQRLEEGFERREEERIRDRPRQAELEKSFQRVVQLLEIQESRLDKADSRLDRAESRLDRAEFDTAAVERRTVALEANMTALAKAQAHLAETQAHLAETQAHADERLSALINIVMEDRGRAS